MTKNTMIFIFLNMIYLLIWYATNKIRSTKVGKELDNGFEFYNGLNTSDKEKYWKEDTKILNLFFVLFIISMDTSVLLLFNENNLWIFSLVAGLIISSVVRGTLLYGIYTASICILIFYFMITRIAAE